MGRAWVPEAKEIQDATICWQGGGHSILGRKRRYYVTQEKYNKWSVLCKLARPAEYGHLWSDEEDLTAAEEWVNRKDPDFFRSGLMALEHHWSKCITLEGNYIEKEEVDLNQKWDRLVTY